MSLNGCQIYAQTEDQVRVIKEIRSYVRKVGCAAWLNIHSDNVSPIMIKRTKRVFTVSVPRYGYICIWEDGSWSDKKLAQYISERMKIETIWLMLSEVTDCWGFIKYKAGAESEKTVESDKNCFQLVMNFADKKNLPYALLYSENPNDPDAEDETPMNIEAKTDLVDIKSEEVEFIDDDQSDESFAGEALEEWEQKKLEELQADYDGFKEITLKCNGERAS